MPRRLICPACENTDIKEFTAWVGFGAFNEEFTLKPEGPDGDVVFHQMEHLAYAGCTTEHLHITCLKCGKIFNYPELQEWAYNHVCIDVHWSPGYADQVKAGSPGRQGCEECRWRPHGKTTDTVDPTPISN